MLGVSALEATGIVAAVLAAAFTGWAAWSARRSAEASAAQTKYLARARRLDDLRRIHDAAYALGDVRMELGGTQESGKLVSLQHRLRAALATAEGRTLPACNELAGWTLELIQTRSLSSVMEAALKEIEEALRGEADPGP